MFARRPRPTTRRWLVAIAIVAAYLGACRWAESWRPTVVALARQEEFARAAMLYDREAATCEDVAVASRNLMRAELDLARDRRSRIEAITNHLLRVGAIIIRERSNLEMQHRSTRGSAAASLIRSEMLSAEDQGLLMNEQVVGRDPE